MAYVLARYVLKYGHMAPWWRRRIETMKIKCPVAHRLRTRLINDRNLAMLAARTLPAVALEFVQIARNAQHQALAYARQDRV
jgi:hypothetical protein